MTAGDQPPTLRLGEYLLLRLEAPWAPAAPSSSAQRDEGLQLEAQLQHAPTEVVSRLPTPDWLAGIGQFVYAEVEGLGRCFAETVADAEAAADAHAEPPRLRFTFGPDQLAAVRAGAEFGFGIDHPRQRVGASIKRAHRALLFGSAG